MRVRDVRITAGAHSQHPLCEWTGCREIGPNNEIGTSARKATFNAYYQIRTGRVLAGQWQDRMMGLCDEHARAFHEKYCRGSVE